MATMMDSTTPQQQQQKEQQTLHHTKKALLLRAVDTFDKLCAREQPNRVFLGIDAKDDIDDVKFLKGPPPLDGVFFEVPHRDLAGLRTVDGDITNKSYETHYLREEVTTLWRQIDGLPHKHNLAIQGQPGTGKSTAVWRKVLEMAGNGDNVLWVSLARDGTVKAAVYFQGRYFYTFDMKADEIRIFLSSKEIHVDTVVLDGRSQHEHSISAVRDIEYWVKHARTNPKSRAISTASIKVERLRRHQNDEVTYVTVHSWSIEDFNGALLQEEQPTALFDNCAELFYEEYGMETLCMYVDGMYITEEKSAGGDDSDDDVASTNGMEYIDEKRASSDYSDETGTAKPSPRKKLKQISANDILALIASRYEFTGGSARWMFNYKKEKIERYLKDYCDVTINRQAIQNGAIGPTSNATTNYFFGSSRKENGRTEYFLVSKRAVEILGEATAGAVYPELYNFAERLENPSFFGWVVEADFFSQVDVAGKTSSELKLRPLTKEVCTAQTDYHARL